MEGKRLIKSIRLKNLLSFGSKGEEIELEPLNVLIGRNASGKSNFIEAFSLLRGLPRKLEVAVREAGGIHELLWKGSSSVPEAEIESIVSHPKSPSDLRYKIGFTMVDNKAEIINEIIESEHRSKKYEADSFFWGKNEEGKRVLSVRNEFGQRQFSNFIMGIGENALSWWRDPDRYPEISYLGDMFKEIKIYQQWDTGRKSVLRTPQRADEINDFLAESAINLGLVLNYLERKRAKKKIIEKLKDFYREAEDYFVNIEGGTVQVFIQEEGLNDPIPATRLSDGTLRYLCLLTILCHPSPPPLICIEEPELGLHPDVLPTIADLLIEASQRTQLIVTTHSDILVDALSETPEAILVCERDIDGTHLRRLERDVLKEWLEKYTLGELWRMGEIGAV